MENLKSRIEKHSIPVSESGCWLWEGSSTTAGYGQIAVKVSSGRIRPMLAHRVSYEVFKGEVGDAFVLHKCDVKCCVNPDHLFLGDHKANMADMVAKGRQRKGSAGGCSSLSADQIREIRDSSESQYRLALRYSVTQGTISNIKNRKTWKHVI